MLSDPPDVHYAARRGALAWSLALAYTLLIAYASLPPFSGWREPPPEVLHFLTAPWPEFITREDVLVNIAAYVPLGLLLAVALRARFPRGRAVLLAAVLSALVSLAMETVQMFIPSRIASNLDLLANAAGALLGAIAALLLSPRRFPGERLVAWRDRVFAPGAAADAGIVVVLLWLVSHLNPVAQAFGTGNLRATFELPAYFIHTPQRLLSAEALVVFFNLIGLGLLIGALTRDMARALAVTVIVVAAGLALRTVAGVILFDAPGPLVWLTPGVAMGLLLGLLLLIPLMGLSRRGKAVLAMLSFGVAIAAINFAPENPYVTVPPPLVMGNATHLLRLSGIVRALSELWPFLAIGYLAAALVVSRPRPDYRL